MSLDFPSFISLLTYEAGRKQVTKKNTPGESRGVRKASVLSSYSLSDAGSDRFLGDFLLRVEINSCAEGGTDTAPLRTISSASTFLLQTFSLSPFSGRR